MKYQAKIYQQKAIDKILNQDGVGLFLGMGLGKTSCTLTAINHLINIEETIQKVLVIAPLRVAKTTWTDEWRKWDHLHKLVLCKVLGSAPQRKKKLANKNADIYIINRENVPWLVEYLGKDWFFDMVVIDELTSFKNRTTKRWKAIRKVRSSLKKVVGLTGTPIANGLLDLWAQVWLLDQGESLGKSFSKYREAYFDPDQRNKEIIYSWKPRPGSLRVIQQKVQDVCISMKSEDWLDLPDILYNRINVELDDASWSVYDQFERERLVPFLNADIEAGSAAAVTTKLLQMTGGACYDDQGGFQIINSHKLDALEDIVEVMYGNPILVYYHFQHELARLQERFPQAVRLKDEKDIERWNESEIPIMLAHPASAGHGLNLQFGGSTIVWYTLTYSLEYYQQANARLHRHGQKNKVMIHHLTVRDSIDDAVIDALNNKDHNQEALLAALKYRVQKISDRTKSLDLTP